MHAFPVDLISGVAELGIRPGVPNIEVMALAAQLRAVASSQHLSRILLLVNTDFVPSGDEAFIRDRWLGWRASALTTGIAATILAL